MEFTTAGQDGQQKVGAVAVNREAGSPPRSEVLLIEQRHTSGGTEMQIQHPMTHQAPVYYAAPQQSGYDHTFQLQLDPDLSGLGQQRNSVFFKQGEEVDTKLLVFDQYSIQQQRVPQTILSTVSADPLHGLDFGQVHLRTQLQNQASSGGYRDPVRTAYFHTEEELNDTRQQHLGRHDAMQASRCQPLGSNCENTLLDQTALYQQSSVHAHINDLANSKLSQYQDTHPQVSNTSPLVGSRLVLPEAEQVIAVRNTRSPIRLTQFQQELQELQDLQQQLAAQEDQVKKELLYNMGRANVGARAPNEGGVAESKESNRSHSYQHIQTMMHNLEQYGQSLEQEENDLIMQNDQLSARHIHQSILPRNPDEAKLCSIEDPESIRVTGTNIKQGGVPCQVGAAALRQHNQTQYSLGDKGKLSGRNTTCLYDLGGLRQNGTSQQSIEANRKDQALSPMKFSDEGNEHKHANKQVVITNGRPPVSVCMKASTSLNGTRHIKSRNDQQRDRTRSAARQASNHSTSLERRQNHSKNCSGCLQILMNQKRQFIQQKRKYIENVKQIVALSQTLNSQYQNMDGQEKMNFVSHALNQDINSFQKSKEALTKAAIIEDTLERNRQTSSQNIKVVGGRVYLPVNLKEHQFQEEVKERKAPLGAGAFREKANEKSALALRQKDEPSKSYSNLSHSHSRYGAGPPRRSGRDGKADARARGSNIDQGLSGERRRMLKTMMSPQSQLSQDAGQLLHEIKSCNYVMSEQKDPTIAFKEQEKRPLTSKNTLQRQMINVPSQSGKSVQPPSQRSINNHSITTANKFQNRMKVFNANIPQAKGAGAKGLKSLQSKDIDLMLATNMLGGLQIPIPLSIQANKTTEQPAQQNKTEQPAKGPEATKGVRTATGERRGVLVINMSSHMQKKPHLQSRSSKQMQLSIRTPAHQRSNRHPSPYDRQVTHLASGKNCLGTDRLVPEGKNDIGMAHRSGEFTQEHSISISQAPQTLNIHKNTFHNQPRRKSDHAGQDLLLQGQTTSKTSLRRSISLSKMERNKMEKLSQHSQNSFCQVYENDDQILQSIGENSTVQKQDSTAKRRQPTKSRESSPEDVPQDEREFDNPEVLSQQLIRAVHRNGPPKANSKGDSALLRHGGSINSKTYSHSKRGGASSRQRRSPARSPASVNKTLYIQDVTPSTNRRDLQPQPEKNEQALKDVNVKQQLERTADFNKPQSEADSNVVAFSQENIKAQEELLAKLENDGKVEQPQSGETSPLSLFDNKYINTFSEPQANFKRDKSTRTRPLTAGTYRGTKRPSRNNAAISTKSNGAAHNSNTRTTQRHTETNNMGSEKPRWQQYHTATNANESEMGLTKQVSFNTMTGAASEAVPKGNRKTAQRNLMLNRHEQRKKLKTQQISMMNNIAKSRIPLYHQDLQIEIKADKRMPDKKLGNTSDNQQYKYGTQRAPAAQKFSRAFANSTRNRITGSARQLLKPRSKPSALPNHGNQSSPVHTSSQSFQLRKYHQADTTNIGSRNTNQDLHPPNKPIDHNSFQNQAQSTFSQQRLEQQVFIGLSKTAKDKADSYCTSQEMNANSQQSVNFNYKPFQLIDSKQMQQQQQMPMVMSSHESLRQSAKFSSGTVTVSHALIEERQGKRAPIDVEGQDDASMTSLEAHAMQIHAPPTVTYHDGTNAHHQTHSSAPPQDNFISTILKNKNQIKLIRAADANYMNQAMFNKYAQSWAKGQGINTDATQIINKQRQKINALYQNVQTHFFIASKVEEAGSGRQPVAGFGIGHSVGIGIDRGTEEALSFSPNTQMDEEETEVRPQSRESVRSPPEQEDIHGQGMRQGSHRGAQGQPLQAQNLGSATKPKLTVLPFYSPRTATQPMTAQLKSSATSGAASPFQAGRGGRRSDDCLAPSIPINSRTDFTIHVKSSTQHLTARAAPPSKSHRPIK